MDHALKRFRLLNGIPAAAIALAAGTTRQTVYRIERLEQCPSLSMIQRLIAASGGQLSADDFLAPLPRQTAADAGISCAQNDAAASAALSINPEAERLSVGG